MHALTRSSPPRLAFHLVGLQVLLIQLHAQARSTGRLRLFKSTDPKYADGAQRRDFVYVRDCAEVVLWLLDNPKVSGLFNLGSGKARSFLDLANAVMRSLPKLKLAVEFFDMPESLKPGYQNFTEAPMARLRAAGYKRPFTAVEEAVADYVTNYLEAPEPYR